MKKLIALFLVLVLAFGLTGCSKLKSEVATLNEKVTALQAEVATKAQELEAAAADKVSALEAAAADKAEALKTAAEEKAAELAAAAADKAAALEAAAADKAAALEAAAAEKVEAVATAVAETTAELETAAAADKAAALEAAAADKAAALEAAAAEKVEAVATAVAETTAELETAAATAQAQADAKIKELTDASAEKDAEISEFFNTFNLQDVVVLYTNDVHCGVNENMGYHSVVAAKQSLIDAGHNVILVDIGDALQGDTIGTLSKGEYIIDIMNAVGYDIATIGNHEFDYGMQQFKALVARANFPYISCNFVDLEGKPVLDSYKIVEADGWKIAFVGISTPKTLSTSTPTYFMDGNGEFLYSFQQDSTGEKLYTTVQNTVNEARAAGADIVIAMGHLGVEADCSPWTSYEVIANTTGIDVFLDGHSHSVISGEEVKNAEGKNVLLTSTGTKLANIGCLTIDYDGSVRSSLISDNGADAIIVETTEKFADLVNQVVAHTDVDLCTKDPATGERMVRTQETNLGDLCADAYRAMSVADIAILNGGGVRADIPAGDITYGQIIAVHPFGNSMCKIEATGEEIWQALELGASKLPAENGGFLHVSSNVTYTIDLNVPSPVVLDDAGLFVKLEGDHRVTSVTIDGVALDPAKTYTLACHDYKLKNMGDGYSMFKDNVFLLDSVMIDNQVLINYIVDVLGGSIGTEYANPYGEGRITIVPAVEAATEQPAA